MDNAKKQPAKKLQVVSFHSTQGGVGKSTKALELAKGESAQGKKVCVIDLDVIGAGLMPLLTDDVFRKKLARTSVTFLEQYLLTVDPKKFDFDSLAVPYQTFHVIMRLGSIDFTTMGIKANRKILFRNNRKPLINLAKIIDDNVHMLVRNEVHYKEIKISLNILLKKLATSGFDLVIIDCHTGTKFVAESLMEIASGGEFLWKQEWLVRK